jgi:uncharacterized membrane protein
VLARCAGEIQDAQRRAAVHRQVDSIYTDAASALTSDQDARSVEAHWKRLTDRPAAVADPLQSRYNRTPPSTRSSIG